MSVKKSKSIQSSLYPIPRLTPKTKDLPATQGMMHLMRSEWKSDIGELRSEMNAEFKKTDARFSRIDGDLSVLKAI
jgi:hypothetical protein